MYTISSEYYCGLPYELWEGVIAEAEDLLIEQELGTHLVGIYPAGNRIYGDESSSQGLLCLYIDTVESLLDPTTNKEDTFKRFHIGNQNSEVIFVEFHAWVRWILTLEGEDGKADRESQQFLHLIPCFHDVVYQDSCIDSVIALAQEMFLAGPNRWSGTSITQCHMSPYYGETQINAVLDRTTWIWDQFKEFTPNLNEEWSTVFNFEEHIDNVEFINSDNKLIEEVVLNKKDTINYSMYITQLLSRPRNAQFHTLGQIKKDLRKETVKLYRSLA